VFWKIASGSSFGELLRGAALATCLEQLSGTITSFGDSFTNNFGEQFLVVTSGSSFREPLCRIALGNRFGE